MVDHAINEVKADLDGSYTLIQLYGRLHSEADNAFHEIVDNLSMDCSADVEIMGAIAGDFLICSPFIKATFYTF